MIKPQRKTDIAVKCVYCAGVEEDYEEVWQMYPAQEGDRTPCCMVTEGAWTWFGSIVFTLTLLGNNRRRIQNVSCFPQFNLEDMGLMPLVSLCSTCQREKV
jgi:hypothetical protein